MIIYLKIIKANNCMKEKKIKVIALYLPQFHCIPENDKFWGKGFTDWVTVKKAKPIYEGHLQPKIPYNSNYYDLSLKENVEWQANLAKKNGIYGFGVYHYWFNNEQNLLTKPAEILRDSNENKIKYFYIWDNNNWKRSWSNVSGNAWAPVADTKINKTEPAIMVHYILGEAKDWENHYNYLRTHFLSENYEKIDNKPIFGIISYSNKMYEMCQLWNKLAIKDGFDGIHFVLLRGRRNENLNWASKYTYQPHYVSLWKQSMFNKIMRQLFKVKAKEQTEPRFFDYDEVWKALLKQSSKDKNQTIIHGAFVGYDDSPRRGNTKSSIVKGATPEKFKKYFSELINITKKQNKEYIFLTAWNEWGEGAFLEPDEFYKFEYLSAVRESLGTNT